MADDLREEMRSGFARVDNGFARVDSGFARVDSEFARVDGEFAALRSELKAGLAAVFEEIRKSSQDDRRYFRILAEDIRESVRIVAEGTANNTSRLDDHETRLKRIERRRRS